MQCAYPKPSTGSMTMIHAVRPVKKTLSPERGGGASSNPIPPRMDAKTEDRIYSRQKRSGLKLLQFYQTQVMFGELVFLSQAQAATMFGVSKPTIKRYECYLANNDLLIRQICGERQAGYIRLLGPGVPCGSHLRTEAAGATHNGQDSDATLNDQNLHGAVGYSLENKLYDSARGYAYALVNQAERADTLFLITDVEQNKGAYFEVDFSEVTSNDTVSHSQSC